MTDQSDWRPATKLVRGGLRRSQFRETSEALFLNSGFVYDDAAQAEAAFNGDVDVFIDSRNGNPTVATFEDRLAALEGAAACRATATGMAAVFAALLCQVKAGDRVVAARELFGSCHYIIAKLLPRWGVEVEFVKGTDLDAWEKALSRPTTVTFLESPSNPMLDIVDIAAVTELSHRAGARLVIDNVFATPLFQRPLELGADVVVYSATKHIDGQGRCLGGAVLGAKDFIDDVFQPFYRNTGPSMSPFNAWVMAKALETLDLRVERQTTNAARIAGWFEARSDIKQVRYPGMASHPQHELAKRQMSGFGSLVTIELPGGKAAAFKFLDALSLIDISNNLGDAKSLVCHPSTTTHSRLTEAERLDIGVTEGVVRLSIGLEAPDDLLEDIEQALAAASAA
ncbi:MAG: O-succinylhomoserine sulfhydrylase [Thalassobaculum sp.]|uniref:O-succinylhomoserine sulfhydrylase n=1 Tax=Thalassobaculum sp. TaxID=2022740 RepID=UPI0032EE5A77